MATLAVSREGGGGEGEGLLQEVLLIKLINVSKDPIPPTYSATVLHPSQIVYFT